MTSPTALTVPASTVVVGDILVVSTMARGDARMRVIEVQRLAVRIEDPATRTSRVYDTVRIHGGGSLDYAPDYPVRVIRA